MLPLLLAMLPVLSDLPYLPDGHERHTLDLYLPAEGRNLPLVVWIHGGGWQNGSKANVLPLRYLAGKPYAIASINYRLSGHAIFPAQIDDCKAAVAWLRANAAKYRLNPDRFAVWGSSAGGHLAALLGASATGDSRVQAVVDFFGPTDLLQMDAHALPGAKLKHDAPNSPESKLIGGPIQENKEKAARANPVTYVTKDDPPYFIAHGDQDPLVPHHQSELLAAALRAAGVPVTFHTVAGGGHGTGFDKDPDLRRKVLEFLAATLEK